MQARTGIKGKPFEKIKFAVVKKSAYSKPVYLENGMRSTICQFPCSLSIKRLSFCSSSWLTLRIDDILSDVATDTDDMIGLDHPDKNGRGMGSGRSGGPEIRIK